MYIAIRMVNIIAIYIIVLFIQEKHSPPCLHVFDHRPALAAKDDPNANVAFMYLRLYVPSTKFAAQLLPHSKSTARYKFHLGHTCTITCLPRGFFFLIPSSSLTST